MMRSKHISSLLRENPPLPHNEVSAMNIAVITGASSGMGKEFTTRLITENDARIGAPYDEIWIIARSEDKLISLQKALSPERIRVIPLDLRSSTAMFSKCPAMPLQRYPSSVYTAQTLGVRSFLS